jgi:hypothetical protein
MIRSALAIVIALAGCSHPHLGPDHGLSYHPAFAAQRDKARTGESPALSATDAQGVLTVHRGKALAAPAPAPAEGPRAEAPVMSGSTAAWPGSPEPINIGAK